MTGTSNDGSGEDRPEEGTTIEEDRGIRRAAGVSSRLTTEQEGGDEGGDRQPIRNGQGLLWAFLPPDAFLQPAVASAQVIM
jgi:hypothetical protein